MTGRAFTITMRPDCDLSYMPLTMTITNFATLGRSILPLDKMNMLPAAS